MPSIDEACPSRSRNMADMTGCLDFSNVYFPNYAWTSTPFEGMIDHKIVVSEKEISAFDFSDWKFALCW